METLETIQREVTFKLSISQCVAGFLYRGGEIYDAGEMLKEVAKEYEDKIQKEANK